MLQIIAERKQYHEDTGRRYLKFLQDTNDIEIDDKDVIGSMYKIFNVYSIPI